MSVETNRPFKPSASIIPMVKQRPNIPEKIHPDRRDAEIEKRAIWLKVSNEKAKRAPMSTMVVGLSFFFVKSFARKLFIPTGSCGFVGF